MLSRRELILRYSAFSALAMAVNLGTQYASFAVYTGYASLYLGIVAGTGTGLLTKYVLDKYFIFAEYSRGIARNTRQFGLYTFMGVFTTIIFWGTELTFDWLFTGAYWRYIGGAVGLVIGYICKYHLDKRYVFRSRTS